MMLKVEPQFKLDRTFHGSYCVDNKILKSNACVLAHITL